MPGLLFHSAATVIKYLLVANGHGSLALSSVSWPIIVGTMPPTPDEAIAIYSRNIFHKGKTHKDGEVQEVYGVDLRLRASEYALGDFKILSIMNFLDKVGGMSVNIPTTISVGIDIPGADYRILSFSRNISLRGAPNHLGKERRQDAATDIVSVSNREIFTFSGKVNLRMI